MSVVIFVCLPGFTKYLLCMITRRASLFSFWPQVGIWYIFICRGQAKVDVAVRKIQTRHP